MNRNEQNLEAVEREREQISVLELFGGIGACTKALKNIGMNVNVVDYVEIDKYAVKSYNAINGTNFEPQDIKEWNKYINVDLIMHGSPCQDFSVAGKQAGGDLGSGTRSSLLYETIRIVGKLKPKYVVWENVKNLLSKKHKHNFDNYINKLDELGYNSYYQVLDAKDYGVPQHRERIYTVSIRKDIDKGNFKFPEKESLKTVLKDLLEKEVDGKYYLSEKMVNCFMSNGTGNYPRRERFLQNINRKNQDIANAIITTEGNKPTCNFIKVDETVKPSVAINFEREKEKIATTKKEIYHCECDSGWQDNEIGIKVTPTIRANNNNTFCLDGNWVIRKLTPRECWRLMGFDDEDFDKAQKVNSNTQLYKQAGNSIVVRVLEKIFRNLLTLN